MLDTDKRCYCPSCGQIGCGHGDRAVRVPIEPHPLTAATMPMEGETIGYTGRAYFGEDFGEHDYVTGPLLVTDVTGGNAPGFYATTLGPFPDSKPHEVFVMLDDDGRQILHGFVLDERGGER